MANEIVINELLCFVSCKYGTSPHESLMSAITGFCEVDDIYEAKKKLNEIAEKCMKDPPTRGRRQGEGRKKRECEDLLAMFEALDKAECELPRFVAEDLNKVPSVKASDMDMCVLVAKMSDLTDVVQQLKEQVSGLQKQAVASTTTHCKSYTKESALTVALPAHDRGVKNKELVQSDGDARDKGASSSRDVGIKRYQENKRRVADLVKDWDEQQDWTTVEHKKKKKTPPVFGTKAVTAVSDGKPTLKAAKEKRTWHVYVGNLDKSISADEVRKYLNDHDVEVMACDLVDSGVEHWDDRPASFHVEIDYAKKDNVMQDSFWDLGVKVRQWFFPRKNKHWS